MHDDVLATHGGLHGVRDPGLLESALGKPQNLHAYDELPDMADLGAAYCTGIARNLPFLDGNKRTAFVALAVFLRANGWVLTVPEPEVVLTMLDVAMGAMDQRTLAAWIRIGLVPVSGHGVVRERARPAARRAAKSR
jgi:death on curing protein